MVTSDTPRLSPPSLPTKTGPPARTAGRLSWPGAPLSTEPGLADYTLRVCERIEEIDAAAWDSVVAPHDLQATHRFVKLCQRSGVEHADYRHVLLYHAGEPVGVASITRMTVSLDLLSSGAARSVIRWLRRWRPSFLRVPLTICGLPVSFGGSCVRFRPGVDGTRALEILDDLMARHALDARTPVLCFKEFAAHETAALDHLKRRGYFRAPSLPYCSLPVRWRSFEEYMGSLRAGYRRQVKSSLRVRSEAGLSVRVVEDFGGECERIFALYEQVMERAPFQLERLNLAFLQRLNADLGAQSRAILIEKDGQLLAAAVMLYAPRVVTFLLAGIDYRSHQRYHSYLNLVVEVVREAINAGAETLELGQTSYDLKGRLGALAAPRYIYLKHRNRLVNALLRAASGLLFPALTVKPRRVFKELRRP